MKAMFRYGIVMIGLVGGVNRAAGEVPPELKALRSAREKELREVDLIYKRELEKRKAGYLSKGDPAGATKAAELLKEIVENEVPAMCEIEISSSEKTVVLDLKAGVERLSGNYRPVFDAVDPALKGARFTRVPWQSIPSFTIKVLTGGNLFVAGASEKVLGRTTSKWEEVKELLGGPYMDRFRVFKLRVVAGETVTCTGSECFLFAKSITLEEAP